MLRHIRMTPTNKEIPKTEGRIFGLLQDWIRTFYRYQIPHTPTPHDRVCTCAYPLFTLRSSRRSPYDEPTILAPTQETVYVDNTGKSTSPPASGVEGHKRSTTASSTAASPPTSPHNTAKGSLENSKSGTEPSTASSSDLASSSHASAFLSSFGNFPSLKACWMVRCRRGSRLSARPQTETCYRCEICDGLQRSCDDEAHTDTSATGTTAAVRKEEFVEEAIDEDEEGDNDTSAATAENSSDERYGYTSSTDIVNTAMEDAEVAELRRLDPFHVEVFGKPSWGALLRRASREVQAQFNRCTLRSRDISRYAAQATANSNVARQEYRLWVRAEAQRVREEQRRSMQPATMTSISTDSTGAATSSSSPSASPSVATQLTLSPEQKALIRDKLDTLHIAAYLARYAVAAYGLPYELNFFTSVRELTKLTAEPHSRYVCANSEEQLESMRRMLQGEEPDALLECVASRYSLRVGQPCWALFLDHAAQRLILSFRGSLTAADAVVDFMEGYANVMFEHTQDATPSGSSPSSFSTEPQKVCTAIPLGFYNSVVEAGTQLLPILRTIHAQYGAYTLCVTGHSLGGIQASVFHLLYCGPWRATLHSSSSLLRRTKTLSCPFTSNAEAAALMESSAESTRVTHVPFTKIITCTFAAAPVIEKRVVPFVNAWLADEEKHSGSRLIAMSHGTDLVSRLQVHSLRETFLKAYTDTTKSLSAETVAPSSVAVDAAAVSDKSVVPVLVVPGSMYNVTAGTRRRYLLAVPTTATAVRERIILTTESVLQHFPCLYLRSLTELLNRYEAKCKSLKASATRPNLALSTSGDVSSLQ